MSVPWVDRLAVDGTAPVGKGFWCLKPRTIWHNCVRGTARVGADRACRRLGRELSSAVR